jgi:hypothetical protein
MPKCGGTPCDLRCTKVPTISLISCLRSLKPVGISAGCERGLVSTTDPGHTPYDGGPSVALAARAAGEIPHHSEACFTQRPTGHQAAIQFGQSGDVVGCVPWREAAVETPAETTRLGPGLACRQRRSWRCWASSTWPTAPPARRSAGWRVKGRAEPAYLALGAVTGAGKPPVGGCPAHGRSAPRPSAHTIPGMSAGTGHRHA